MSASSRPRRSMMLSGAALCVIRFRRTALAGALLSVFAAAPPSLLGGPTLAGLTTLAAAHEVRPGYLELREISPGVFSVLWKKPARGDLILKIDPVFPTGCAIVGIGSEEIRGGAYVARATLQCEDGLSGKTIEIAGLRATLTDVLVRLHYLNGLQETHLVQPTNPSLLVGGPSGVIRRIVAYARLGIEHIALGVDHLLFVLGLVLIVSSTMMLLKTITAFTVAHSITLGIATLGLARVPALPVEAIIALSILFLGPEIVRVWRGESSFTIRHPWIVAFAFGLLHGFGFARGLISMGLPQDEIPLALLFFNVGVELGQLAFVFLILGLARSFRTFGIKWPRWAQLVPGYAVGTLGALWFIERTATLLGLG